VKSEGENSSRWCFPCHRKEERMPWGPELPIFETYRACTRVCFYFLEGHCVRLTGNRAPCSHTQKISAIRMAWRHDHGACMTAWPPRDGPPCKCSTVPATGNNTDTVLLLFGSSRRMRRKYLWRHGGKLNSDSRDNLRCKMGLPSLQGYSWSAWPNIASQRENPNILVD
jgi:hypothetical protein